MFFLPKLGCTQHGWHEDLRFWTQYFCGNTFSIFNLNLFYLKNLVFVVNPLWHKGLDVDWTVLRYIFLGDFIIRMSHDNDVTIILAFNRISAFICVFSGNPLLYIYFEVLAFWFATFHKNLWEEFLSPP